MTEGLRLWGYTTNLTKSVRYLMLNEIFLNVSYVFPNLLNEGILLIILRVETKP